MRVAVLVTAIAIITLTSVSAHAKSGKEVLDEMRDDARREIEITTRSEISKRYPYSGSLYGLPGQTRSDSIRESAIRSAISGLFGTCKAPGLLDPSNVPRGLSMDVGGILANTTIPVPPTPKLPSLRLTDLVPNPTEIAPGKVMIGGEWMTTKEYGDLRNQAQDALNEVAKQKSDSPMKAGVQVLPKESPKPPQKPSQKASDKRPISNVWGPTKMDPAAQ